MASSDRALYDRPAILLASVLGVAAVLGSVFFLPAFYCESPSATLCTQATEASGPLAFDVAWTQTAANAPPVQVTSATTTATVVSSGIQGGLSVAFSNCQDSARAPVQQPATITIHVTSSSGAAPAPDVTTTCAERASYVFDVPAPDVATATGANATAAKQSVLANPKANATTVTYTITVTVTRAGPGSPVGLPTDATLTATLNPVATTWQPSLTQSAKEVQK